MTHAQATLAVIDAFYPGVVRVVRCPKGLADEVLELAMAREPTEGPT